MNNDYTSLAKLGKIFWEGANTKKDVWAEGGGTFRSNPYVNNERGITISYAQKGY